MLPAPVQHPAASSSEIPIEWSVQIGGRSADRVTLSDMAHNLMDDPDPPKSFDQAFRFAYKNALERVSGQKSLPHFNEEIAKIYDKNAIHTTNGVKWYHLHGDESAAVAAWQGEGGQQKAIVIKADIPNFAAFNDTPGLGHDFTNELNKAYQGWVAQLVEGDTRFAEAATDADKVIAINAILADAKADIGEVSVKLGPEFGDRKVNLGMRAGIGENPSLAERALTDAEKNIGINGIFIDNGLKLRYNIQDTPGPDLTEQYYDAGMRSTKLEARYGRIKEIKNMIPNIPNITIVVASVRPSLNLPKPQSAAR
jgi:hypothetical protein